MPQPTKPIDRVPSLDGLRAIAITFVISAHLAVAGFGGVKFAEPFGRLGVSFFFVISGFLITGLLLNESQKTGTISLKRFYARRTLRIFPPAFAFLAVMAILEGLGAIRLLKGDLIAGFTYLVDFKWPRSWYVLHLWSLSVEEQFYLLWPFAFARLGAERSARIAAGTILIVPVGKLGMHFTPEQHQQSLLMTFPLVADYLATGCLLAIWRTRLEKQAWYIWLFRPAPSIAMVCATLLLYTHWWNWAISPVLNILMAVLIHRSVYCWRDGMGRVLNWRPVAAVGILSYSLYLWQQPFLNPDAKAGWTTFPLNTLLALGCALSSYFLLEQPLQRWRTRLRVIA